jgi:hypothetical protein
MKKLEKEEILEVFSRQNCGKNGSENSLVSHIHQVFNV